MLRAKRVVCTTPRAVSSRTETRAVNPLARTFIRHQSLSTFVGHNQRVSSLTARSSSSAHTFSFATAKQLKGKDLKGKDLKGKKDQKAPKAVAKAQDKKVKEAKVKDDKPVKSEKPTDKKKAKDTKPTKEEKIAKEEKVIKEDTVKEKETEPVVEEQEPLPEKTKSKKGLKISKKESKDTGVFMGSLLEKTIKDIESNFGKGKVMKLGDVPSTQNVEVISTGSLSLDTALGIGTSSSSLLLLTVQQGGLPRGRMVEIYGPESSGKTTLALHIIAEAHKLGGKCTFIDAEHALDPTWAQKIGVKVEELLVCQPDSGEQALDIADMLINAGTMDVVVIDSVAALVPRAELEGDMGDHHIGTQARLMSQALRKLTQSLAKHNKTVLIFINQIRHKIGVMFGSPETTSGGNALKFFCSNRLDIRKIGQVKNGEVVTGTQIKVKVVKNKLAPPFREALFDIDFRGGISKTGELIDLGLKAKLLEKSGAWYAYKNEKIGQGREKTKAYFEQNPEFTASFEKELRAKLLSTGLAIEDVATVDEQPAPLEELD